MNRKQGAYLYGRGILNTYDIFGFAVAALYGYNSVECFINAQGFTENGARGAFDAAIALYIGFTAFPYGRARIQLYTQKVGDKKAYPLEHAERIFIDDKEGLDFLLEETAAHKRNEWGTLLKAHDDSGRAIIYNIVDPQLCKQRELMGEGTRDALPFNFQRADEAGYNGCHHYHPRSVGPKWLEARNFTISFFDKSQTRDWINLLTFNMPNGPEIIGFNRQYTYLPVDASKRKLARATPKQIMEYLQHF